MPSIQINQVGQNYKNVHGCAKEICLLALFVVKQKVERKVVVCFGQIYVCAIIQTMWNEIISDSLISTLQTWGLFGQIWVTKPYVTITDFQPPLKCYQNLILHTPVGWIWKPVFRDPKPASRKVKQDESFAGGRTLKAIFSSVLWRLCIYICVNLSPFIENQVNLFG